MSYIQTPGLARSLVACAIASLSVATLAQETNVQKVSEQNVAKDDTIVVTATRMPTRYNQLISDVTVVDQEQIRDYSPAQPITDVLANQPGITVGSYGGLGNTSTVQIRGANDNQTVLLVDGLRLNSATTGAPPWSYIPMPQIDRMEIVRGPASSSYGADAIGGVVQLFTRKGEGPMKIYADAGYGTYNTTSQTLGVEGAKDGFSYSVYGANTHSVGFPSMISNAIAYNSTPDSYTNSSASANLSYTVAAGQELGIKALYGSGKNGQPNRNGYTNETATQTANLNVVSVYTKNKLADNWVSWIRVGSSQDNRSTWYATPQYSLTNSTSQTSSYFNTTQKQLQWQNDFMLPVGKMLIAYEYLNQAAQTSDTGQVYSRNISSFQGGWNADIGKHLLQANIRNDANSQFGNATTGSVGYGYFILPTVRATASWGTGFQAPTFNDLYSPYLSDGPWGDPWYAPTQYTTYVTVGNPNLQATKSQNTETAIRYDDGINKAGLTYYYNNVTNNIIWKNSVTDLGGSYYLDKWMPVNYGRSVLQGVTGSGTTRVYGIDLTGSADYQDARDMTTGLALPYKPYLYGNLSVEKSTTFWKLGGQMQAQGNQQTNPGSSSNIVLGGYTLFNLYGSLSVAKDVSLIARLNNVFDKQYQVRYSSQYGAYATPGSTIFVGLRFQQK